MDSIRNIVRQIVENHVIFKEDEDNIELDEERISHKKAIIKVQSRQNFTSSNVFGEDIGHTGKMYVVYSYNHSFPLFVWQNNLWYINVDNYIKSNGKISKATVRQRRRLNPNPTGTQARPTRFLLNLIKNFKIKNNIPLDQFETGIAPKIQIPKVELAPISIPTTIKENTSKERNNDRDITEKIKQYLIKEDGFDSWEEFVDRCSLGDCQNIVHSIKHKFPQINSIFGEIEIDNPYIDEYGEEQNLVAHHWVEIGGKIYEFSKGTLIDYIDDYRDDPYDVSVEGNEWRYKPISKK